ncbi:hypothetical protein V3C99_015639 [Haemonchus contortus]
MSSVSTTSDSASASKYCESPPSNGSAYSSILDFLGKEESFPSYVNFIIGVLIETKEEISELNRRCNAILLENKVLKEENDSLKSQLEELLSSFKVIDSKADRSSLSLPPDADRPLEIDYDLKHSNWSCLVPWIVLVMTFNASRLFLIIWTLSVFLLSSIAWV